MTATLPGLGGNSIKTGRRPVLLFGASGNLGSAICSRLAADGYPMHVIAWAHAVKWLDVPDASLRQDAIGDEIRRIAGGGLDILFAGGDTNPHHSAKDLWRSNCEFPQEIISATATLDGCRYVTFGSIMESFTDIAGNNPYIASKAALGQWVENRTRNDVDRNVAGPNLRGRLTHLQIHTLYGGAAPAPHMFLGQLVTALRMGQPFFMSTGRQLREYHHVDDMAGAVARLLSRSTWDTGRPMALSSGRPVRLAALAQSIFEAVGRTSDLRVGALPTDASENLTKIFSPAPDWLIKPSREPLEGVRSWVEGLLRRE